MRITADTNLLVRVLTGDDELQARLAEAALGQAELVALPLASCCELVWVLTRGYGYSTTEMALAIRGLLDSATVVADRIAIEAGLAVLEAGGDFADGIIAYEGRRLGADTFLTFDQDAVKRLKSNGVAAQLLG